ncbi:hypothetical protein D3C73_1379380 [compost metagenome]
MRAVFISEAHFVEPDIPSEPAGVDRIRCVGHIGLRIHDFQVSLEPSDPFRIALDDCINFLDRPDKDVGQQQESDKLAIGQLAANDEPRPADHDKQRN